MQADELLASLSHSTLWVPCKL